MNKRLSLFLVEFWWKLEHCGISAVELYSYKKRKEQENYHVNKFNENIYGQKWSK